MGGGSGTSAERWGSLTTQGASNKRLLKHGGPKAQGREREKSQEGKSAEYWVKVEKKYLQGSPPFPAKLLSSEAPKEDLFKAPDKEASEWRHLGWEHSYAL